MFDFSIFLIYVVLKGSVVAVRTADKFAPNQSHRFLGICIERFNEGLWTKFTLRNVIEKTGLFFLKTNPLFVFPMVGL